MVIVLLVGLSKQSKKGIKLPSHREIRVCQRRVELLDLLGKDLPCCQMLFLLGDSCRCTFKILLSTSCINDYELYTTHHFFPIEHQGILLNYIGGSTNIGILSKDSFPVGL